MTRLSPAPATSPKQDPAPMKASDLLVKCLENEGITHIFGVPGELV